MLTKTFRFLLNLRSGFDKVRKVIPNVLNLPLQYTDFTDSNDRVGSLIKLYIKF